VVWKNTAEPLKTIYVAVDVFVYLKQSISLKRQKGLYYGPSCSGTSPPLPVQFPDTMENSLRSCRCFLAACQAFMYEGEESLELSRCPT